MTARGAGLALVFLLASTGACKKAGPDKGLVDRCANWCMRESTTVDMLQRDLAAIAAAYKGLEEIEVKEEKEIAAARERAREFCHVIDRSSAHASGLTFALTQEATSIDGADQARVSGYAIQAALDAVTRELQDCRETHVGLLKFKLRIPVEALAGRPIPKREAASCARSCETSLSRSR